MLTNLIRLQWPAFFKNPLSRLHLAFGLLATSWVLLSACSRQQMIPAPSMVAVNPSPEISSTFTAAPTYTSTPIPSATPTPTSTSTATSTPSITPSPTITSSPTLDVPLAAALMRAFCRYGPGKAYLYSHELKEGDVAEIHGRNASGTWLWVQPDNLDRHCWVSASVVETHGDLSGVVIVQSRLPHSTLYGPPEDVETSRDGDTVLISWERVWMTQDDDRGYLIEASVCQNGSLLWISAHTEDNRYELTDERGCSGESGGKLYTVEKHGYTDPVAIPWP